MDLSSQTQIMVHYLPTNTVNEISLELSTMPEKRLVNIIIDRHQHLIM